MSAAGCTRHASGSPVHAGIDRRFVTSAAKSEGFPRTRGDRPEFDDMEALLIEVPPYTRG